MHYRASRLACLIVYLLEKNINGQTERSQQLKLFVPGREDSETNNNHIGVSNGSRDHSKKVIRLWKRELCKH